MEGLKKCVCNVAIKRGQPRQDMHIMLSALHEVLLHKCTIIYENKYPVNERSENKFWDFVTELSDKKK